MIELRMMEMQYVFRSFNFMSSDLEDILKGHRNEYGNIVPFDLNNSNLVIFDFTASNPELDQIDLNDEHSFTDYIFGQLELHHSPVGIGRYNEDRIIYKRSEVFSGAEVRSIHLGIDLWAAAGTPVYAPLDGVVHSFKNNTSHGDYGPTIILAHQLNGCTFHTLYGHLNTEALHTLKVGGRIGKGTLIGKIGRYHENVHWPPHLHFQIIRDMGHHSGDYPGVASKAKRDYYLNQCPDPNLILGIGRLG